MTRPTMTGVLNMKFMNTKKRNRTPIKRQITNIQTIPEKPHKRKERVLSLDEKHHKGKSGTKNNSKTPIYTTNRRKLATPAFIGHTLRKFLLIKIF